MFGLAANRDQACLLSRRRKSETADAADVMRRVYRVSSDQIKIVPLDSEVGATGGGAGSDGGGG